MTSTASAPVPVITSTTGPTAAPSAPQDARPRTHRHDIDMLRILCSIGVIVCHSAGQFLNAVGREPGGGRPVYWIALAGDGLSRCAVPLFFAMAGWVVLCGAPPRDGAQVRRRLMRIVVPMAVWTAAYLVWDWIRDTNSRPTLRLAYESLFGSVQPAYHLWYLYAYVPVIVVLSLAALVRGGRRPYGLAAAFVALALAPTFLDDVAGLFHVKSPGFAWDPSPYQLAYAAAGAFLLALPPAATTGRRRRLLWLTGGLCGWAAVVAYEHFLHYPSPYAGVFVPFLAGALLMALNRITVPARFRPLLSRLGTAAFGAYLVHLMFLRALAPHLVTADAGWFGAAGLLTLLVAGTVALSFAASLLWTRLRLNRWLG
ncbi:acyltransferase [Actinacidiphila glaucinigra]|uniref:acyltransferase n=1 Tax=Actinacidiphila glaucinigra TaxID=235986 RepID=UPI0033CFC2F6